MTHIRKEAHMKRDMDLIRKILLAVELIESPRGAGPLRFDDYDDVDVSYHVMLLHEAGLIRARDDSGHGDFVWDPIRLTWAGHEFLDAARSETLWNKAKGLVLKSGSGLLFDVLKPLLTELIKESAGLQGP
jgi:hypothetical protein